MNSMDFEASTCGGGDPSIADTAQASSEIPELTLDDLVEENYEILDPGCPKTKHSNRTNPKRRCIHCEWTQTGTRQVFVNHVLDLTSNIRTKVCQKVPEEIKAQFKKAMSLISEQPSVPMHAPDRDDVIPSISDEILSEMVDFSTEFWSRDAFIREVERSNRKSNLSVMTLQKMFT